MGILRQQGMCNLQRFSSTDEEQHEKRKRHLLGKNMARILRGMVPFFLYLDVLYIIFTQASSGLAVTIPL